MCLECDRGLEPTRCFGSGLPLPVGASGRNAEGREKGCAGCLTLDIQDKPFHLKIFAVRTFAESLLPRKVTGSPGFRGLGQGHREVEVATAVMLNWPTCLFA